MVPDLARITELIDLLGSPQRAYPAIHLTGTNGKTSTARMIDALLRAHGLRTGRYTSPHLEAITERISIDGRPVSPERFAEIYADIAAYVDLVDSRHSERVTFFELTTAMAFAAFADAPVDVAVVEVGLGGTWDATNVLEATVAVVTTIGLDHTALLGESVRSIATEKAGIIHPGARVVLARQPPEAAEVLAARVVAVDGSVVREGDGFGVVSRELAVGGQLLTLAGTAATYPEVLLPLHGGHQAHNAACALAAVELFLGAVPDRPLDPEAVRAGFAAADSPGRLEVVRRGPTVLLDGAHNPAGVEALVEALEEEFAFAHLVVVLGVLADKDVRGMLERLEPAVAELICTTSSSPRAMPAEDLEALARDVLGDDRVYLEPRLDDALDAAVRLVDAAGPGSGAGILVAGSLVTVGEARSLLRP
jgi:dihydrofolate synthase/folylpolyglutamate synthase